MFFLTSWQNNLNKIDSSPFMILIKCKCLRYIPKGFRRVHSKCIHLFTECSHILIDVIRYIYAACTSNLNYVNTGLGSSFWNKVRLSKEHKIFRILFTYNYSSSFSQNPCNCSCLLLRMLNTRVHVFFISNIYLVYLFPVV